MRRAAFFAALVFVFIVVAWSVADMACAATTEQTRGVR